MGFNQIDKRGPDYNKFKNPTSGKLVFTQKDWLNAKAWSREYNTSIYI